MGRPAHRPDPMTRRQIEAMTAYGLPEADIAKVLAIDAKTLRKHYRDELDTGHVKANSKMAENLYRKAMGDGPQAVAATIFWLKTRAQWKETQVHEMSGKEGGAAPAGHDPRELAKAILSVLASVRMPDAGRGSVISVQSLADLIEA